MSTLFLELIKDLPGSVGLIQQYFGACDLEFKNCYWGDII